MEVDEQSKAHLLRELSEQTNFVDIVMANASDSASGSKEATQ